MILILTSEEDRTSGQIIEWLDFFSADYLRFSSNSKVKLIDIELNSDRIEILISIDSREVCLSDVNVFWYRRSHFVPEYDIVDVFESKINIEFKKHLLSEADFITRFILDYLKSKNINHPDEIRLNKLSVLSKAKELGINFPDSRIVTKKKDLVDFYNLHNKDIITKNITQGVFISLNESFRPALTMPVTDIIIADMSDTFFPTLVQKNIEKSFELRVFYINKTFYSSAIFSQKDEATKYDFRNYNHEKPNRVIPFQMDRVYEEKLLDLILYFGFGSCSLDILVDKTGCYHFLEINPIGQFAQVSNPCNYNLEFIFAEYLYNRDKDVCN